MNGNKKVTAGEFIIWLILSIVTFGIYTAWWQFSRIEAVYRDHSG